MAFHAKKPNVFEGISHMVNTSDIGQLDTPFSKITIKKFWDQYSRSYGHFPDIFALKTYIKLFLGGFNG